MDDLANHRRIQQVCSFDIKINLMKSWSRNVENLWKRV